MLGVYLELARNPKDSIDSNLTKNAFIPKMAAVYPNWSFQKIAAHDSSRARYANTRDPNGIPFIIQLYRAYSFRNRIDYESPPLRFRILNRTQRCFRAEHGKISSSASTDSSCFRRSLDLANRGEHGRVITAVIEMADLRATPRLTRYIDT